MRLRCAMLLLLIACVFLGAGCASTESDMPWNAPQPWEGSPNIPGMGGPGGSSY